jgi:predicted RNase H-like HicB family nuclease
LFWNFGIVEAERMVIMKSFKYVVYREGEYFVSQCLNLDIASFGTSVDDAVENLKDAVSLYLADEDTA